MGIFRSVNGWLRVELVSADITGLLSKINRNNIFLDNIRFINEMTVQLSVFRKDYLSLSKLTKQHGSQIRVIRRAGIYWRGKELVFRPIFLLTITVILLLAIGLPGRILFVQVKGNTTVPAKLILEKAEQYGITMFASSRKVRSEKVKNALLENIPELQWIGVNTSGCVATISVTEKTITTENNDDQNGISSIVASRDGVISDLTVRQGNPLCQVGQAVKEGQTLISAYTDCGISIKAVRADGEIYAKTSRKLQVITPVITEKRSAARGRTRKYSLIFGKKLIKLYKGSGISCASCVKIYDEFKLTLPGGFQLPITLVRETILDYDYSLDNESKNFEWLISDSISYLQSQMIAGQILDKDVKTQLLDNAYIMSGHFSCVEMIGSERKEDIYEGDEHGRTDRKRRESRGPD